jgi:hypothetical protein
MTSVLYGLITDPKYVDMAREESPRATCAVCKRRGAVERAGLAWCEEHASPSPVDNGPSYSQGDATARWQAWVAASSVTTTTGAIR